jgi:putative addiction module component (TIGR02574 family)
MGICMMLADIESLRRLPVSEKLEVIELLWKDIETASEVPQISREVRSEIERRGAEMDADPSLGLTEEELWERVDQLRGK